MINCVLRLQTGKVVDDVQMLIKLVQSSGALDYCKARALEETKTLNTPLIIYPTTVIVRAISTYRACQFSSCIDFNLTKMRSMMMTFYNKLNPTK